MNANQSWSTVYWIAEAILSVSQLATVITQFVLKAANELFCESCFENVWNKDMPSKLKINVQVQKFWAIFNSTLREKNLILKIHKQIILKIFNSEFTVTPESAFHLTLLKIMS